MLCTKIAIALASTVALTGMSLLGATAGSAATGSNAGAVTHGTAVTMSGAQTCDAQIMAPADYPDDTKIVDLSKLSDFKQVNKVGKIKFSPTLEKRSVPGSWATWGSPPDTETATPNILYTAGATSMEIVFRKHGLKTIGVEVEPNPFEVHTFTGEYFNKIGDPVCTITRDADGNAGARVLAATLSNKAKTMRISSDVDFSIAAIRHCKNCAAATR